MCRRRGIVVRVQVCRYRAVAGWRLSIPPALQDGRVPRDEALETDPPLTAVRRLRAAFDVRYSALGSSDQLEALCRLRSGERSH